MSKANKDGRLNPDDLALNYGSSGNITGFVAGVGTASKSDSKWAGVTGSSAYTVGDLVTVLKQMGVLAA